MKKEQNKRVNTTIPESMYEEIKSLKIDFNQLIGLGLLAWKKNPQLIERIKGCESDIVTLRSSIQQLNQKLFILEDTIYKDNGSY